MIDSHHHLWAFNEEEYGWIPEGSPIRANFLLPELESATKKAGVSGTVVVQARQIIEESEALIAMGRESDVIKGIVGWVPLVQSDVEKYLELYSQDQKFKGVRHVLQGEPDDYFLCDDFHRGLKKLPAHDLIYDLLLVQRQLPVATRLVDKQPDLPIVIDHIAKPEIHNGRIEADWKKGMKEMAKRENIIGVKISGMVNEVIDEEIDEETLKNYFLESLEIFGPDRLMFGTDWPVCLERIESYTAWTEMVKRFTADLSADEQSKIHTKNASRCYGL